MRSIKRVRPPKVQRQACVVLLHGILRTSWHMRKLARFLRQQGYEVINFDYPSRRYKLDALTGYIWSELAPRLEDRKTVHFVGYSMGALLTRSILSRYRPENLGRAVFLAPPNSGSEVADFWKNNWLFQRVFGPAGAQCGTDQCEIAALLGVVDYECGVIAGNVSLAPISSLLFEGANDGKVAVARTRLEGMHDHIIVPASHMWFPYNREVHHQTLSFLENGAFAHKSTRKFARKNG